MILTSTLVDALLESGLTVVVYSGQLDLICATLGQLLYECRCEGYISLCVCTDSGLICWHRSRTTDACKYIIGTYCVWEVVCIRRRRREEGENVELDLEAS